MKSLGNLIWFIFYGLWAWIIWTILGLLWCITIVGIPCGLQCFKIARVSALPFGKEIEFGTKTSSLIFNIIWIIIFGWELAVANVIAGCIWCITVVGIPFGLQCFKMMKVSLLPFGIEIKNG